MAPFPPPSLGHKLPPRDSRKWGTGGKNKLIIDRPPETPLFFFPLRVFVDLSIVTDVSPVCFASWPYHFVKFSFPTAATWSYIFPPFLDDYDENCVSRAANIHSSVFLSLFSLPIFSAQKRRDPGLPPQSPEGGSLNLLQFGALAGLPFPHPHSSAPPVPPSLF